MSSSSGRTGASLWWLLPQAIFLFVLPVTHTVSLRLLCLTAAFVLVLALWKRYAPPTLPCKFPAFLWAGLALLSLTYSVDPAYSAQEIKNEIGYVVVAFVVFYASAHDARASRLLLGVVAAGFVVLSTWALFANLPLEQWDEHGYYGGSASFASYLVTVLPLLLLLHGVPRSWRAAAWAGGAALLALGLACGFLTEQRIVWPVVALQTGLAAILLQRKRLIAVPGKWLALGLVAVLALSMLTLAEVVEIRSGKSLASLGDDIRLAKLDDVIDVIREKPLGGHGFGQRILFKSHPEVAGSNLRYWHAHNIFLNYGVQLGIPGMLVIALLFACLLYKFYALYRADDARLSVLGITGIVIVVGVIARNQVNDMLARDLGLLFFALVALLLGYGRRQLERNTA